MNKLLPLCIALSLGSAAFAQGKLDMGSRARLRSSNMPVEFVRQNDGKASVKAKDKGATAMLRGFAVLSDGASAGNLEACGAKVFSVRGNIALVEFPAEALEALEALDEVKSIRLEQPVSAKLNIAREVSGIDKIHSGIDLPQAYTGKGVVAGSVDGGFDPNHINFKNDDGTSRIGQFTYYRPTQQGGYVEQKVPRENIGEIDTEDDETFHGTHTLGIMAGSYRGDVSVCAVGDDGVGLRTLPNPYYGIACDADIAVASGALTDMYIAMGIETILDYAYDSGQKPAVVNLSLGSNVGPHDGTSTICQYLDLATQLDKVIFCVSAGNEGDLPIALHKKLTVSDNTVASFLHPEIEMTNYKNVRYGTTYIYSDSNEPFTVQAVVVNKTRGRVVMRMSLEPSPDGASRYWVSSSDYAGYDTDIVSTQFANYFEGYVGLNAEIDSQSGRYYAVIDCMCWDNTVRNADGNYILGFEVTGSDGQRIDIFGDGIYNTFSSYEIEGYEDGMTDGTISDMACGHNYVVVGSYNTRDEWLSLDGNLYGNQPSFAFGKVSYFSSYGELYDGRRLPTVCAPGTSVISSSNEYYIDAYGFTDGIRQAAVSADGRRYSWHQSSGTSMATPVVSGAIALWLEAYPELTYDQAIDIIRRTSVVDSDVLEGNSVQWGAGKFDAYAGLVEVLKLKDAGIGAISADKDNRVVLSRIGDRSFGIYYNGCKDFTATLYSVAGATVSTVKADGYEAVLDATGIPAGVYLLSVPGAQAQRIMIK